MYRWRPMERRRIDTLLAERGLAGSRTSAAESVRAGRVRIGRDGPRATKPGQLVPDDVELLVDGERRYVSRGGIKLEHALDDLGIEVTGRSCLDVGASTGGFTDCLLRRGAARVIALDVGYGQLDWRPSQRPTRRGARAHQRPRPGARTTPVPARAGDGRRLVHLAGQGVAGGRGMPGRRGRDPRDGQAAVRARARPRPGRGGARARGSPRGAARRGTRPGRRAQRQGVRAFGAARGRRATGRPSSACGGGDGIEDLEAAIAEVEA